MDIDSKSELVEILSAVDQFISVTEKRKKLMHDSISDLIVSQNFFDEDVNKIFDLINEINPTLDQLSDLSYSKQKLFYHTFNEMFMAYSGISDLINKYKEKFKNTLKFGEEEVMIAGNLEKLGIHSNKYTQNEYERVKMMEEILPQLFGYRFVAALKLGAILFYRDGSTTRFQPVAFNRWLVQEQFNAKRMKSITASHMKPYTYDGISVDFRAVNFSV